MKPPPKQLSAATSKKWHARSLWNSLGYMRVRSLSNPKWRRDSTWLAQVMTAQQAVPYPQRPRAGSQLPARREDPRSVR